MFLEEETTNDTTESTERVINIWNQTEEHKLAKLSSEHVVSSTSLAFNSPSKHTLKISKKKKLSLQFLTTHIAQFIKEIELHTSAERLKQHHVTSFA